MLKKFNKILVANRGEIAIRIFRACSELGIKSVGIYSKEDKYGLFRTKADESYLIGEGKGPIDAYLDMDGIIDLAKRKKVDAIHPGYGFLAENAEFARKCEENGITFIGPSSKVMNMMGDKINSKKIAKEVNVQTIPGVEKAIKSTEEAKEVANKIGYPVMIKASNGGGGRGMRIVHREEDLEIEYETACSESRKAFGEDIILYDNKNVFNLHINDKNKELMEIDDLNDIENEIVGYTLKHAPFFIQEDFDSLTILKSFQKEIISIKNSDVKDIVINKELESENSNFVETEIKFNNQKLTLNLSKNMVQKLMQDVFIYAKQPLLKDTSIEVLYKNWSKAMNDMIIFNFFGNIYYMKYEFDKVLKKELNDEIRIDVINELYKQVQEQRNNLDLLSAYMPRMLESQEIELFEKYNVKLDMQVFKQIKNLLFDLSYNISSYLDEVEKSLDNIIFVISGEDKKKYNYRMLKESESASLDVFLKQAISRLNHLVENMYPYYVDETSREMFKLFEVLWKSYKNINDDSIKEILFERITNTYVFRQLTLNNGTNERRKDIIEKIYNSVDYGANKLDENMFFTGGIKYVK